MSVMVWLLISLLVVLALGWLWTRQLAADAEKAVPRAGQVMPITGGAIHYTDEGPRDGQTLVLIHGLAGNMHNFTHSLTGQLTSEYRVITLDRPGSGYSSRAEDALALLPAQAAMIGEFLDRLGIDRPALVGHSLGGALALAMALDRKDKIGALALLCPLTAAMPGPPAVFKPLVIRSALLRRLIGHTIAVPIARLTRKTVIAQVFAPEKAPADFLVRGGAILGLRPASFIGASTDLEGATLSMPDQVARYASELKVPGGILFGSEDNLLSPGQHGLSMQEFGLTHEELPGCGHMIPITAPEACADFIRRMAALSR
ncbi:MAG: alpha/beta hydrolase [Hoeflea sp.]|uniref:alpha/beta fold hydrolase n=1 Tax=Hoeflea sp. TaxID=1940281 RepID=UPI001D20FB43|nr:alpha/beta hydrolase [Hoeflea sp.]MBU4527767.1 alpha/beta hydrolase [Alphaproteobacteria bacterium]MBU4546198.1 alpha/beta hydrolase [Alphaproteobacteria bacterium]MBU4553117.1 alpha/beta hydrolase [Alphaproteobacteria bacterium]MBV1724189.1 alpha/beta hydrolase [Hoeflea sp.]MBV1759874.1 alpha/beta hydrolase [Hoeflea sp.]